MRTRLLGLALALLAGLTLQPSPARVSADHDNRRDRSFSAALVSFNEVPAVSSGEAKGFFRARLNRDGDALQYSLTYSGLSATVTQAHIHLGKSRTNGSIMVWLCQTAASVDPTTLSPTCPATEGTVEGTITAANVIKAGTQGVDVGEFDEFVRALREDAGYANVHTTLFPTGEIRGQVK
jgi:CHRD domain